jgi:site-specific DNA-cytosine methylase
MVEGMRVLVACEFSGIVRDAFLDKGHDAVSCDILPTESEGPHYECDVRDVITLNWDLMIAHPPCTHLAVSGARWFKDKQEEQREALDFVRLLLNAPIDKIALENPVGIISTRIRKSDQIIQPYEYGHPTSKRTCLWLKNLPRLEPTNIVEPNLIRYKKKDGTGHTTFSADYGVGFNTKHGKRRSGFFKGIAKAMAEQWSESWFT